MFRLLTNMISNSSSHVPLAILYVTAGSKQQAELIGSKLVTQKLAACCNLIQNVNSIYFWQGKVNNDRQILMIIKSRQSLVNKIAQRVKQLHSYKIPQVIALPIIGGSQDYTNWVIQSTLNE